MLKGLVLTPPEIGRISIGKTVERQGKRMPEKDDGFTITSQVQGTNGWYVHPVDETLRKPNVKLRNIPIRLLFTTPELNLRSSYSMFDRKTGRPLCVGNGETCKRATSTGMQTLPCATPDACDVGIEGHCKPYGRLNVRIGEDDELGSFVFRTTGFNSIRTLSSRLSYFHAVSGGLLTTLPLELRLRGKSTTQSYRAAIYYVDLTVRTGLTMAEALAQARQLQDERLAAGFDQAALDAAARQGFANGVFEESEEEGAAVVEEFYPEEVEGLALVEAANVSAGGKVAATGANKNLAQKLSQKAAPLRSVQG